MVSTSLGGNQSSNLNLMHFVGDTCPTGFESRRVGGSDSVVCVRVADFESGVVDVI